MRRLAFIALVVAAGCGESTKLPPGPSDVFYKPVGVAVYGGRDCAVDPDPACRPSRLVVASSNSDLRYDDPTGGSVIAVDPTRDPAPLAGTINIRSFAGQVAVADPAVCPIPRPEDGPLVVLPVRGDDVAYRLRLSPQGALTCTDCETSLASGGWADAFTAGVACGPGVARAYVGYLRSAFGQAVFSQLDLTKSPGELGFLQTAAFGTGSVTAFAYDAPRKRLYFTRTATGLNGTLGFIELGNGCTIEPTTCASGAATAPRGLELRGIALASSEAAPRRAYISARIYDAAAAASAGVHIGDFDGLLLVVDLVENLAGQLELHIVNQIEIGYGAADVVRLPVAPSRAGKRDVVAALAADDGSVWIYDDETGESVQIGHDLAGDAPTGAPLVGHFPFGLAADPVVYAGNVGRVYVGSFQDNFVTPIEVPLDDIRGACPVAAAGTTPAPGQCPTRAEIRRIGGGAR